MLTDQTGSLLPDRVELLSGDLGDGIAFSIGAGMPTHVLLIDDEPSVRSVACTSLRRVGFTVTAPAVECKASSDAAIEAALQEGADVLLLDLRLPHIDTAGFLGTFHATFPECCVLLIAGFIHDDVASHFLALGADGYLEKPFRMHHLVDRIESCLETRAATGY